MLRWKNGQFFFESLVEQFVNYMRAFPCTEKLQGMMTCLHHSCRFPSPEKAIAGQQGTVPSLQLRSSHKILAFFFLTSLIKVANSRENDRAVFPPDHLSSNLLSV